MFLGTWKRPCDSLQINGLGPWSNFFFHRCTEGEFNHIPIFRQSLTYTLPRVLQKNFRACPSHKTGAHGSLRPAGREPPGQGETKDCSAIRLPCLSQTFLYKSAFFLDPVSEWGTRKTWQLDWSRCGLCISHPYLSSVMLPPRAEPSRTACLCSCSQPGLCSSQSRRRRRAGHHWSLSEELTPGDLSPYLRDSLKT